MIFDRNKFIGILFECVKFYSKAWNEKYSWEGEVKAPIQWIYYALCQNDFFLKKQTATLYLYMKYWNQDKTFLGWDFSLNIPKVDPNLEEYKMTMTDPWNDLLNEFTYVTEDVKDPNAPPPDYVISYFVLDEIAPSVFKELATESYELESIKTDFEIKMPDDLPLCVEIPACKSEEFYIDPGLSSLEPEEPCMDSVLFDLGDYAG